MTAGRNRSGLADSYPLRQDLEYTPREANALLHAGRLVLVDCRTQEEFEFAHIQGAIHIPLAEIETRHDEIELPAGSELAVMCHLGVRSMRATMALRTLGFDSCRSIAGGIDAWSLGADASIPRYVRSGGLITRI